MTISNINLPQLLADLDALRIEALPLAEHGLANFDIHVRESYAAQLATLLLVENTPSENQSRLFCQLLDALNLGSDAYPRLLEQAQKTNQQSLREFLQLVEEHQLAASFIVDGLVLCRLDEALTETQSQVFSEYTQLMQVQETDLIHYVHLAAKVLGLPSDDVLPTTFDFTGYKLQIWKEFFYRELTQKMLDEGFDLDNGLWVVKTELTADTFILRDAVIRWDGELAKLNIKESLKLTNCIVTNPLVRAIGDASIELYQCEIKGWQPLEKKISSFVLEQGSITIENCNIQLKNSRVIYKSSTKSIVKITDTKFVSCGNSNLYGGVFFGHSSDPYFIQVHRCDFISCTAENGAVFCLYYLIGEITGSLFENCFSKYFDAEKAIAKPDLYMDKSHAVLTHNAGNSNGSIDFSDNTLTYSSVLSYSSRFRGSKNKINNSFFIHYLYRELPNLNTEANDFERELIINRNTNINWDKIRKED
ncbi:MAG: hypothetical protein IBX50_14015 [Marinospirillum sp.]|uniref:hypothetical protein n=1 Tax=Marinospirillum sp. TaxID=2183934 RepID=UPI001A03FCAA|nr:hypothetical protein [Marinospirillum sp.]MBE0507803.1 hypothetical protein [Marinospirillum sp.]